MPQSTAEPWERVTSLAMLGLARSPGAVLHLAPDPSIAVPDGSREQTLLRSAAALLLWRLAGERAGVSEVELLTRASEAQTRVISEPAARRLARMLTDGPRELVELWFDLAAQSGRVLPPHWIPAVFGAILPAARTTYAAVFGERIGWLAAQDPQWAIAGAAADPTDEEWASGSISERVALLGRMRTADPARARAWLESTWATEAPDAREKLIELLGAGLSAADESFLESALEDKRKTVRLAAAETLARLPQSAYVQRALARLEPLFVFEPQSTGLLGRLAGRKLRIELPAALDKAAVRDAIEAKPPATRQIGERAYWLMQLIAIVPPAEWCRRFSCTPAELLSAAAGTDYADDLCGALAAACARHPDVAWTEALCTAWGARVAHPDGRATAIETIVRLIATLPSSQRDAQLRAQIEAFRDQGAADAAIDVLMRLDHRWSTSTTSAALEVLELKIRGWGLQGALPRTTLEAWARRAHSDSAAAAVALLLEKITAESPWHNALERLRELLEFRTDMQKELLA